MSDSTSAYTVARRILGVVMLTVGQMAQLRAIDRKYQQRLFALLAGAQRVPTAAEVSQLDAMAETEILEMLTPEQRRDIARLTRAER
jgi:hypothetical protein